MLAIILGGCFPGPLDVEECTETCDDDVSCTVDFCVGTTCTHTDAACECRDDSDCGNRNDCDGAERCNELRRCVPGKPKSCEASQAQCMSNVCNPATGDCEPRNDEDETECSDGNPCTEDDECDSGVCNGVVKDCGDTQLCSADSCNENSGACEHDLAECECDHDEDCDDHNACTRNEGCGFDGKCRAGVAVECNDNDNPCRENKCDEETGSCREVFKDDATECDDGDECTGASTCVDGNCVGSEKKECSDGKECSVDSCDSTTGECKHDTAGCPCDSDDDCPSDNPCVGAGTCDTATSTCLAGANLATTQGCDDHDNCTFDDHCDEGNCVGTAVECTAKDACHDVGTCQSATGECSTPNMPEDTPCDEGNLCTFDDHCVAGSCVRRDKKCLASDQCHVAGVCEPATGVCTNPDAPPTTSCDDGDHCTVTDQCSAGSCIGNGSPDNVPADWNVSFGYVELCGMAQSTNGSIIAVFPVRLGHPTVVGPTEGGGTFSVSVAEDEKLAYAFGRYDAAGRLVSLSKAFGILDNISGDDACDVLDTGDGFYLTLRLDNAPYRLATGQLIDLASDPETRRHVVLRYDVAGAPEWWLTRDSKVLPTYGAGSVEGSRATWAFVQSGPVTFTTSKGATATSGESKVNAVTIDADGSIRVLALPGIPTNTGMGIYAEAAHADALTHYWLRFAGTQDFGEFVLESPTNESVMIGGIEESGTMRYAVGVSSNLASTVRCAPTGGLLVCMQAMHPGDQLYDADGPIHTFDASRLELYALTDTGGLAWTRALSPENVLDPRTVRGRPSGIRIFGIMHQQLSFEGALVPATDPGANRSGNLIAELSPDGDLVFAELVGTSNDQFFAVFGAWLWHQNGAMTFAGRGGGVVTVGIDVKHTDTYDTTTSFLSRVNSAAALGCE